ncbi:hypothetical protein [Paragemmobacter ruber]|uniref:Flagellin n=1 Tax=Paragemmobacter ruber TaxID=1985673 RepID=A0ABW9Y494_9RHOB|nr:hypothetical protein [Rhodobacter ruber]NBE07363.1 hypothetical protein [Rhodobacter ruber]
MTTVTIGDMAQLFLLRRSNAETSREIGALSADLARGTASDVGRQLGGRVSSLAAIETELTRIAAFGRVADQGAQRATAMQTALERLSSAADKSASVLLRAAQSADARSLGIAARDARAAFEDAVAALNTRFADQSLFSGTATDRRPLPEADTLLAAAKTAIGTGASASDAATVIEDWLSDPAGFLTQVYSGSADVADLSVGTQDVVRLDVTAADPALQATLKGLLLGALMSEPGFDDRSGQLALASLAGTALLQSSGERVMLSARIGSSEARIAQSQARQSAEALALEQARTDLIAVDGYDVATRLEEARARLEMIYTLTARLSRLSLSDYL